MKHSRKRKEINLELFRVRRSQPPGRGGGVPKWLHQISEFDEVKGVCPESEPEPRECMKVEDADPLRKGAGNTGCRTKDEWQPWSSGVTDSIESDRGYVATRRGLELLGDELPEYRKTTSPGSLRDGSPFGMRGGLAMKRGNSRGVKALTYQHPCREKHGHYPESDVTPWQLP